MNAMASACATSPIPLVSAPSACPSSKITAAAKFRRRRTVSCRATGRGDNDGLLWLPRRDMMLTGLSGVAAGLAWYPGLASADAEDSAPVSQCPNGADMVVQERLVCTDADTAGQKPCTAPVADFAPAGKVTRVRQAAHLLSRENQDKYKEAVAKMKALPASNPLSFKAQAAIHQAYCDSFYTYHKSSSASKDGDPVFDVHFSWIFAPWHRMYIYFYEKALGDLIGDDTFALPFWNWDAPDGMVIPALFKDSLANPLYDPNRNKAHLDKLLDLDNGNNNSTPPFKDPKDEKYMDLVNKNLCTIYRQQQVRRGAGDKDTVDFLGEKYCTDIKNTTSMGSLEKMAHTAMHIWVGKEAPVGAKCSPANGGVLSHSADLKHQADKLYNCNNDMGFLGTAGHDPLFYSHHANVDRMWHLWSAGGGKGFDDKDWLGTSFVFYDDVKNPRKVRVKFSDVLDTSNLGYTYAESGKDLPWLNPKITSLTKDSSATAATSMKKRVLVQNQVVKFPLTLVQNQVVEVPGVAVPAKEKGKEQVLVIDGIEFDPQTSNKFDVAINVPADKALQLGPQHMEYAGSFAVVPGSGGGTTRKGKVSLCITDVLADIGAAGDGTVDVVIVPRTEAKVTLNARPTIQNRK